MKNVTLRNLPELSYAGNEAINTLCTNLTFSGENIKVIMLTSCHASEGKSFLALNIVRTMAKLGKRVCLIDCDLRKSLLARRYLQFDTTQNRGATHFLAGMADIDEVLYETDIPNMYIVPCGRNVSNSLPLVTSSRLNDLIHTIAVEMDYVMFGRSVSSLSVLKSVILTVVFGLIINFFMRPRLSSILMVESLKSVE